MNTCTVSNKLCLIRLVCLPLSDIYGCVWPRGLISFKVSIKSICLCMKPPKNMKTFTPACAPGRTFTTPTTRQAPGSSFIQVRGCFASAVTFPPHLFFLFLSVSCSPFRKQLSSVFTLIVGFVYFSQKKVSIVKSKSSLRAQVCSWLMKVRKTLTNKSQHPLSTYISTFIINRNICVLCLNRDFYH